jgi:hypothetical protein
LTGGERRTRDKDDTCSQHTRAGRRGGHERTPTAVFMPGTTPSATPRTARCESCSRRHRPPHDPAVRPRHDG